MLCSLAILSPFFELVSSWAWSLAGNSFHKQRFAVRCYIERNIDRHHVTRLEEIQQLTERQPVDGKEGAVVLGEVPRDQTVLLQLVVPQALHHPPLRRHVAVL